MSDQHMRDFFNHLRSASRQMALYPDEHPALVEVVNKATDAANGLLVDASEQAITIIGDSLYLERTILPHASLEFNRLLRDMQARGVDSVTLTSRVSRGDMHDLAAFLAATSGDVPAEGTIRLNERPYSRSELETDTGFTGLRRSYARSLDVLRGLSLALDSDESFDLTGATWVVEQLVEQTLSQPAASVLLSTMKSHDEYTFYHSVNVCILSIALARMVGLPEEEIKLLAVGALLHDIGKVRVPIKTLQWPGRLDTEQWAEIKLHPQEGAAAILAAAAPGQEIAAVVAFEHHARFDRQGYPTMTYSRPAHFFSRLVSTADTYDALTTRRSYRRAETPNRALRVLLQGAGSLYDPDLVQTFIKMVGVYPVGSLLELDTGGVVMVTGNHQDPSELADVVLVRASDGLALSQPEPATLKDRIVVDQLTSDRAGVDPASLIEQLELDGE